MDWGEYWRGIRGDLANVGYAALLGLAAVLVYYLAYTIWVGEFPAWR